MFANILIVSDERASDGPKTFPIPDLGTQLFEALQGRDHPTLVLSYPPFLAGAAKLSADIRAAKTHAERIALRSACNRWFENEVAPHLRALGSRFVPSRLDYLPTASVAIFECFVWAIVGEYHDALSNQFKAKLLLRTPATVSLASGDLSWQPYVPPKGTYPDRLLVSGVEVARANVPEARGHTSLPHWVLLPPQDLSVIPLALDAYPDAKVFYACRAGRLSDALDAILPPGRQADIVRLRS